MKRTLFILSVLLLFSGTGFSQKLIPIKGKVTDEKGKGLSNVKVLVNGEYKTPSGFVAPDGSFGVNMPSNEKPDKIKADFYPKSKLKAGYIFKEFKYDESKKFILITMEQAGPVITGKVFDKNNRPVSGIMVNTPGTIEAARTDSKGGFILAFQKGITPDGNTKFVVDNLPLKSDGIIKWVPDYFELRLPVKEAEIYSYTVTITTINEQPFANERVSTEGKVHLTGETGTFEFQSSKKPEEAVNQSFSFSGYRMESKVFDDKKNFNIVVSKIETQEQVSVVKETKDSTNVYKDDFNRIFFDLDIQKQQLTDNGAIIRSQIDGINNRLGTSVALTKEQRDDLQSELERLHYQLIANETAYEDAQAKTHDVVQRLEEVIVVQDSLRTQLEKVEVEAEQAKQTALLEFFVGLFLLALVILFLLAARRFRRQRNTIKSANREIETLSEIGQKISSLLDFEMLAQTLHENVDSLMDAAVFGVGAYNEKMQRIEFRRFVDDGEIIPYLEENMQDSNKFSVWCMKNLKPVIVNDLAEGFANYLNIKDFKVKDGMPRALIYLPLISEGKAKGVITVQSFKKGAYNERSVRLLETLSSYVAIALDNTKAYELINEKNNNITAGIRYAKTIQQAILPSEKEMQKAFGQIFTLYRPKDIVSGDFFWMVNFPSEKIKFIAVVDCTGHGVPGAFMSVIGHSMLNEITKSEGLRSPAAILNSLNEGFRETLRQDEKANDDGMDVCLCALRSAEDGEKTLTFSGAKRPLFHLESASNTVQSLRGDLKSVGGLNRKNRDFTDQTISFSKNDMIYLTSDGLVDQADIGGEKFGTSRLTELITEIGAKPLPEQLKILEKNLDQHSAGAEQRDDITLIGIRL